METTKDFLHKYLVLDKQARVITVFSTNTVKEYSNNKDISPVSLNAMARLISATLMMGSLLKGKEKVMVSIDGNGPIGVIRAEADAFGNVRTFATNPKASVKNKENGTLDVASLVGSEGYISVRKQLNMKEPFIGTCELISGEIGEDISYYFGTSEQTPTIVALGVKINPDGSIKQSGGFLIQLLPNAKDEAYNYLDEILHKVTSVSKLIEDAKSSDQLVYQLFDNADLIFEYPLQYKCNCNIEKTKMLLSQLPKEDLVSAISDGNGLDITCNFCEKVYHVSSSELEDVLKEKDLHSYKVK